MKLTDPLPLLAIASCCGLAFIGVACDSKPPPLGSPHSDAAAAAEGPQVGGWPVPLNAGQKWKMDGHTRNSIARMKQLVQGNETDTLGKSLAGEFHDLMKGCTMQGEAHDQLHVFLNELMPGILALPADGDDVEFKAGRERIRKLLQEYERYFE